MRIADALEHVSLLYVETAPFIYYTENRLGYIDKLTEIFGYVDRRELRVITAALTLTETLIKPLKDNDTNLIAQYQKMFYQTRGIAVTTITPRVGEYAATLRAQYNLRTPDALHLATAIESGCDAFLTNDLGLKRVQEISVLILDELEISPRESE